MPVFSRFLRCNPIPLPPQNGTAVANAIAQALIQSNSNSSAASVSMCDYINLALQIFLG